ncbi:MAG TPA: helix-hairpin-helix domain-containing protein, partial [Acidimicrobiales bacterium]|nr:helix-hairpin-helix domain-containing protein [Acidimicrobiales bacterium]
EPPDPAPPDRPAPGRPPLPAALAGLAARATPWSTLAAAAVAVVVVAAVVVGAVRAGGGGPPVELTLPRAGGPGDPSAAPSQQPGEPGGVGGQGGGEEGEEGEVYVHVAGAVVHPGLYRLRDGARVAGALDAAGGPTPGADLDAVNLAARLADGERLYVPRPGETAPPAAGPAPASAASAGAGSGVGVPGRLLDLNRASPEELDALPGIGPATAAAVVAHRQEHGPFRSVDELVDVRGIGEAKLATIRPLVRV